MYKNQTLDVVFFHTSVNMQSMGRILRLFFAASIKHFSFFSNLYAQSTINHKHFKHLISVLTSVENYKIFMIYC
jgi:hypothetical protein